MFFGRDRNRLTTDETHAISHPTRLRILEMFTRERGRPMDVDTLAADLVTTPGYEHVKPSEVNYHRARLMEAKLLPDG